MADAVKIMNGPSKYDVLMSLFEQKELTFELEHGEHVARQFTMIVGAVSHRAITRPAEELVLGYTRIAASWRDFMLLEGTGSEPHGWDGTKRKAFYVAYSTYERLGIYSSVILAEQATDPIRQPWGDLIFASSDWRKEDVSLA